jgi:hypothetical protein
MRQKFEKLTSESQQRVGRVPRLVATADQEGQVTYKGTIFLTVTISSIVVGLHQLLLDMDVHLPFPTVGNMDFITVFGLAVSGISGVFAFQQIKLADIGLKDVRRQAIKDEILREIDEGKMLTDRLSERLRLAIDSLVEKNVLLEKELFSLRLQLEKHADLDLHIGAQRKLDFVEDKLYEVGAAVKLLTKSDETLYRISRLEQSVKSFNHVSED